MFPLSYYLFSFPCSLTGAIYLSCAQFLRNRQLASFCSLLYDGGRVEGTLACLYVKLLCTPDVQMNESISQLTLCYQRKFLFLSISLTFFQPYKSKMNVGSFSRFIIQMSTLLPKVQQLISGFYHSRAHISKTASCLEKKVLPDTTTK